MSARRVILVTIALHDMAGGLEKNFVRLGNALAERGDDVQFITFDRAGAQSFYPLHDRIRWHQIGESHPHTPIGWTEKRRLISRMRQIIKRAPGMTGKTDVIVFTHGLLSRVFAATLFLPVRVFCSERNSLTLYNHIRLGKWNLNFLLLHFVKRMTVQLSSYVADYPASLRGRIRVIPNVVEEAQVHAQVQTPDHHGMFTVLAVGRMCDQKNYPQLIEAFTRLAPLFPDWRLVIVGGGGYETRLRDQIEQAQMQERIEIVAPTPQIVAYYVSSHVFCMPSKWEGFPNALAEALAHGLPAVGYRACAGVSDLIEDGKTGVLADQHGDVGTLATALGSLMRDPEKRGAMSQAAVEAMRAYAPDQVFPLWAALLDEK